MGKLKRNENEMRLTKLKLNPKNPRTIKDEKFKQLVKSLKDFPEMMEKRPMVCVTDVDGKLYPLGGNMRLKALTEIGYKDIPDSWVQLADEWTVEQRNEFVIKDNVGFGEWDWAELKADWDVDQLEDWGLDVPDDVNMIEIRDLFDIEIPFYTPSDEKPNVNDLASTAKADSLIEVIDGLNIDDELKKILKFRASFFVDFDFQKIADFYFNSNEDIKGIFESLGMVILSPKKALENSFIEIGENINDL